MGFWPVVIDVIKNTDIIVVVADARMPELSINEELLEKMRYYQREHILAFTKIDLLSQHQSKQLRSRYPGAFFVSGIKNRGISYLKRGLQMIAKKLKIEEPRIGIVGYPNVGKSAIINALAHRRRAAVADISGTTRGVQWVKTGSLRILDTPGVIPLEDSSVELTLIGAKGVEKLSHPEKIAVLILERMMFAEPEALKEYYRINELPSDKEGLMEEIARKRGFLRKGGLIDEHRTAVSIIRDWQHGKLKFKKKLM